MPIATEVEFQLIEQAYLEARPLLEPWFGEALLRENLAVEIARDLGAARRGEGVRLIELPGSDAPRGRLVVVGHGIITSPVPTAVVHQRNFAIDGQAALRQLAATVREVLGVNAAQRVLVLAFGEDPPVPMRPYTYHVAGLIDRLRPSDSKPVPDLRLEVPDSLGFYEEYAQWYEEFWHRRPHLKDIWIEPRKVLEHCLEQDGLRLVYFEDKLCGLLAAERRVEFGLSGWRMRERVTAPGMWGRGVSTAAVIAFAQSLAHDERTAIWGTIVPANESSLVSALRIGRRIVSGLYDVS